MERLNSWLNSWLNSPPEFKQVYTIGAPQGTGNFGKHVKHLVADVKRTLTDLGIPKGAIKEFEEGKIAEDGVIIVVLVTQGRIGDEIEATIPKWVLEAKRTDPPQRPQDEEETAKSKKTSATGVEEAADVGDGESAEHDSAAGGRAPSGPQDEEETAKSKKTSATGVEEAADVGDGESAEHDSAAGGRAPSGPQDEEETAKSKKTSATGVEEAADVGDGESAEHDSAARGRAPSDKTLVLLVVQDDEWSRYDKADLPASLKDKIDYVLNIHVIPGQSCLHSKHGCRNEKVMEELKKILKKTTNQK